MEGICGRYMWQALPYITTIFGGLSAGRMILVQGMVPRNCRRFRVDFQCGSSVRPRANIAFRFSPGFGPSPSVTCNTLWNGRWGAVQRVSTPALRQGYNFHIIFQFEQQQVLVIANGKQLLGFRYRRPLGRVDTLQISGPVFVKVIGFLNKSPYLPHQTEYPSQVLFSLKDPKLAVPLQSRIEDGLAVGRAITIRGELHQDPREFVVLLKEEQSGNVPLRLSADFESKALVRSSLLDQAWGREQRETLFFSLHPGRYFEMLVLCGAEQFRVAMNGTHFADYGLGALCLERVRVLEVSGDLELYCVEIRP
ncbi:galectin-12-like isoform X2 [Heptranchias perlo]|uniref:galectin-12-like isoform X2 n=1 Tax=Heptranchias perlo TaxID=212740 RepID=UPI003559DF0F